MSGAAKPAGVAAVEPLIKWAQSQAEQTIVEHADVFALIRKAEISDPRALPVLMACLEAIEEADPATKAGILDTIRVRGKGGRPQGSSTIGQLREPFVSQARHRISAGEVKANVIDEMSKVLPGAGGRPATSQASARPICAESFETQNNPLEFSLRGLRGRIAAPWSRKAAMGGHGDCK